MGRKKVSSSQWLDPVQDRLDYVCALFSANSFADLKELSFLWKFGSLAEVLNVATIRVSLVSEYEHGKLTWLPNAFDHSLMCSP